ncbi:alpha/beta hydrolase [Leucobacter denitrificans]|uniref:Alpha/beta fold hydrolase n=1 Tax=Leucobacter denitrificans TaxID=683042 RepID=A0A7G9S5P6_9MICO|nr:alpha/beta fold hydrolase [Leucobacter denitrificans]QNN63171.1 alpha/beta fold hydrolase [Leucobacter denitrificans]
MNAWRKAVVAGSAAAAAGLTAGAAAFAASVQFARSTVRVAERSERSVRVLRVVRGEVTRVWLAGEGVDALGRQSLLFETPDDLANVLSGREPSGHARLGPVVARSGISVLREVERVDRGTLEAGAEGRMVGWWYTRPEELGYRVERTSFESEIGELDAWIVRPRWPRKRRWAVHVHGRGARPEETFRGIAPLARAGVTSLIINYRNDEQQPPGHGSRYGLGISESRDVDAAVGRALDLGAERVTLVGWSMGGTASLLAAADGVNRHHIDGIILDSPGIDWPEILRWHTRLKRAPLWIANVGMRMLRAGLVSSGEEGGIDVQSLRPEHFASRLSVPTLVLASPDDRYVPWAGARELAGLCPEHVQLVTISGARHVRLWNVDPERWEQAVLDFAAALPRPGWRGQ